MKFQRTGYDNTAVQEIYQVYHKKIQKVMEANSKTILTGNKIQDLSDDYTHIYIYLEGYKIIFLIICLL